MKKFCETKCNNCIILNAIQYIFCYGKKYTQKIHRHAKLLTSHTQKHKHRFLMYIHIGLLVLVMGLYNFTTFNKADDVLIGQNMPAIMIENEPQIFPDESSTGAIDIQEEELQTDETI